MSRFLRKTAELVWMAIVFVVGALFLFGLWSAQTGGGMYEIP